MSGKRVSLAEQLKNALERADQAEVDARSISASARRSAEVTAKLTAENDDLRDRVHELELREARAFGYLDRIGELEARDRPPVPVTPPIYADATSFGPNVQQYHAASPAFGYRDSERPPSPWYRRT